MRLVAASAALMGALLLSACASGPTVSASPEAKAPIPAGASRVVVYRTQIIGAAIQPDVFVDGVKRGSCKPKGAFYADVAPGEHTVSAKTEVRRAAPVTTAKGETAYVRCSIGMGLIAGRPHLESVPAAEAAKEVGPLAFTGRS